MPDPSIPLPRRCESCGHVPPPPAHPDVARWNTEAARLAKESRAAFHAGQAQVAATIERRAVNALMRAIRAQADVELGVLS